MTLAGTSAGQPPPQRKQKHAGNFSDAAARRDAEANASVGRLYSSARYYATVADSVLGIRTCSIIDRLDNTTITHLNMSTGDLRPHYLIPMGNMSYADKIQLHNVHVL